MGYICGGCGLFPWLASAIFVAEIGEYPDVSRSKSESQTGEQEFRSNIGCDIVGFICDGWDFMCFFLMDVILWALFMADVILWDLFARDLNLWAFSRCRPMWYCGFYLRQMVLCGLYLWQMGFCGGGGFPRMVFCGLFPWLTSAIFVAEIGESPDVSQTYSVSQTRQQEVHPSRPVTSVLILITREIRGEFINLVL